MNEAGARGPLMTYAEEFETKMVAVGEGWPNYRD